MIGKYLDLAGEAVKYKGDCNTRPRKETEGNEDQKKNFYSDHSTTKMSNYT